MNGILLSWLPFTWLPWQHWQPWKVVSLCEDLGAELGRAVGLSYLPGQISSANMAISTRWTILQRNLLLFSWMEYQSDDLSLALTVFSIPYVSGESVNIICCGSFDAQRTHLNVTWNTWQTLLSKGPPEYDACENVFFRLDPYYAVNYKSYPKITCFSKFRYCIF